MRIQLTLISLLISLLSLGQGKILFENNFDDKKDKFSWKDTCCGYSITVDSTHSEYGKYCQKIELRKNETVMGNTDGKRAEASWNSNAWQVETHTNMAWYRISIKLDSSWIVDNLPPNGNPESFFAIHDGEPCSNRATNPFGIWVNGDHYETFVNASTTTDYCSGGSNQIVTKGRWNLGPIQPGKFVTFILHFKNSIGNDGYDSVWNGEGKLLMSYNGPNWYKGIFPEGYLKMGIYKWGWKAGWPSTVTTRILYQDNIKIGDTSCRLSNFILTPTPPPVNVLPKADAGPDQNLPSGTKTFTLTGNGTDPDGTIVGYFWKTFKTPTGWMGTSTSRVWTLGGAIDGLYGYELTVTDNKGGKGVDTCYVNIAKANRAPVITYISKDTLTLPIATDNITVNATDADNDSLSYVWKDDRDSIVSFMPTFTRKFTVAGLYQFKVTVSDGKLSTTGTASILVNPIPPKLVIGVSSVTDPKTGGLIVTLHHADGTTSPCQ